MQDKIDLKVDDTDGDLVVDESGDLQLSTALEAVQQDIKFRARTGPYDYDPDPFIGANLGSFKGRPNVRRTGDFMKSNLHEALVRDGRFARGDVVVDAIPVSKSQVAMIVFLRDSIVGLDEELYNNDVIPLVTVTVDLDTALVDTITGGTV
jgi:hypothetical protein